MEKEVDVYKSQRIADSSRQQVVHDKMTDRIQHLFGVFNAAFAIGCPEALPSETAKPPGGTGPKSSLLIGKGAKYIKRPTKNGFQDVQKSSGSQGVSVAMGPVLTVVTPSKPPTSPVVRGAAAAEQNSGRVQLLERAGAGVGEMGSPSRSVPVATYNTPAPLVVPAQLPVRQREVEAE